MLFSRRPGLIDHAHREWDAAVEEWRKATRLAVSRRRSLLARWRAARSVREPMKIGAARVNRHSPAWRL